MRLAGRQTVKWKLGYSRSEQKGVQSFRDESNRPFSRDCVVKWLKRGGFRLLS